MLKFRCTHCNGRLALQERHLGRLVHCPECHGLTHPMAEEILARQKRKEKLECANCGQPFGKLQKPRQWERSLVCAPCHRALSVELHDPAQTTAPSVQGKASKVTVRAIVPSETRMLPAPRARRPVTAVVEDWEPIERATGPRMALPAMGGMLRAVGMGLLLSAAAVIVILYIIHAIGTLLLWAFAAAVLMCVVYAISRGIIAYKRRFIASEVREIARLDKSAVAKQKQVSQMISSPTAQKVAKKSLLMLMTGGFHLMYLAGSAFVHRGGRGVGRQM